jgi:DNA polymerase-3 subunit gamma/tau
MAYVALYRKYRSQSFDEVIGQQHVTIVLQNAIRLGRIAHAYLFCGPRGCGKTSTARLLARALNCQAQDGPTPTPCGECEMCLRIRDGSAMDVIEMDAASETGIDDVREKIIENAKYAPGQGRYKVYIIDEVHDLSAKAFDSLLKTIEEPPAHVVFILATTEAHKVPITIRSRCQRMDFRRGTLQDLTGNIRRVLDKEQITYDVEAIEAVARAAEGSFRDSLSLLEQSMAYADGKLTLEAVMDSIGSIGPQMLDEVMDILASDDLLGAWQLADRIIRSGKDVRQTLTAIQTHFRDLLAARVAGNSEVMTDVSPERFAVLKKQAVRFTPQQLLAMLDVMADAERSLRFSNQHRLLLERALWKSLPSMLSGMTEQQGQIASPERARIAPATIPPKESRINAPPAGQNYVHTPAPAERQKIATPIEPPSAVTASYETNTPVQKGSAAPFTLEEVRSVWPTVRSKILNRSPSMRATLNEEAQIARVQGDVITIAFPNQFALDHANKEKGRKFMAEVFTAELGGRNSRVECILGAAKKAPDTVSPSAAIPKPQPAPPAMDDFTPEEENEDDEMNFGSEPGGEMATEEKDEEQMYLDLVMDTMDGTIIDE